MQILKQHEITGYKTRSANENRCYICKRTESEVHGFLIPHLDGMTEKYNTEIINLESKLQNMKNSLKSHLDDILRSTENLNLDFKINSVLFDMDSFKKITPKIKDLIDLRKDFPKCSTLSEIRIKILELRKEIEDDHIYEKNRKINLENNIGKKSMWYSECGYYRHVESFHDRNKIQIGNEKIEATLESLEKLVNEKDSHLQSLENKKEFIKKLKHHKISHEMTSIMNIINKESSVKNEEVLSKENHEEFYKTPITLPICVICHSLVCHESTG